MKPIIYSGDLFFVYRSELQVRGERIYLINLDDEVMVKRVEWLFAETILLSPENKVLASKDLRNSIYLTV
jgi:phage repressor protein C with HTH and peptisase S24 domain